MKTLLKLAFLGILVTLLTNCHIDSSEVQPTNLDKELKNAIYMIDLKSGKVETISIDGFDLTEKRPDVSSNARFKGSVSANGHFGFTGLNGAKGTITFSAVKNNGGVHGNYNMAGNPAPSYKASTTCLLVEGNEAVYGGLITKVINRGPFPGVVEGNYMYIKVKDSGAGKNAPADQVASFIFISPFDLCELGWINFDYACTVCNIPWSTLKDLDETSDKIQVNP